MLTEIYIEALLVDEELADQVWAAWNQGQLTDEAARLSWSLVVVTTPAADTRLPGDAK